MKQCRICLEEDENINDLISPCQCDGTQKYVHSNCLELWRDENTNTDNYKRCQECLIEYRVKIVGSDSHTFCIYKNVIRYYHFFINKVFAISIFFHYLIFFGVGKLINIILGQNNNIIVHCREISSNYELLYLPMITAFLYCILTLVFYNIMSFYLSYKNDSDWQDSTGMDIIKLNNIHLVNFLAYLIIPLFGFFVNLFVM